MSIVPEGQQASSDLANALRELRKSAGLSGERLAVRCAMSQTKISRIECGKALPTVIDVERILTALKVPVEAAQELISLARQANVEHTSWRTVAETGLWRKQAELKALTESCKEQRLFLPAMPSGLLQMPEYAIAALTPQLRSDPARDVRKAVQVRLDRQALLDDPARQFWFLMTEQAVMWKYVSLAGMAQQCAHMAEVAQRPNVHIGIIPRDTQISNAALNTFVIYDDRLVIAELFSGEVVLRDPLDVVHHRELFDFFYSNALIGDRAIDFLSNVRDDFMRQHD